MLPNDDPALQTGPLSQTCRLQVQDEKFSFTPVKIVAAPRRWDRKPSNGFLARSKSRKVWKRFRSSFNSMKALQRLVAATHEDVDDDLFAEINVSRGLGLVRGVKRQCFGLEDSGNDSDAATARGRSFLETKWESEATGRRRKLPTKHSCFIDLPAEPIEMDDDFEDGCNHVAGNEEVRDTATSATEIIQDTDASFDLTLDTSIELAPSPTYPRMLHGVTSCLTDLNGDYNSGLKPDDNGQSELESDPNRHILKSATGIASADAADDREPSLTVENTDAATASTQAAPVQDLDAERESTLVRSALRSSLDGEDAALLNNFLSKAKAARAAKASVITSQEEKTDNTSQEMIDMPTQQTRRVLEELDANSPSPSKPQLSPVKAVDPNDGPAWGDHQLSQDINVNEGEDPQSASPIRRSSRNRTSKVAPRTTTPTLRPLTLRRAKGTEFVFLQRTAAQELALATRRNTRQNRGDAVMPKYVLQALAQHQHEPTNVDDDKSARDLGRKRSTAKKFVTWNEAQLVQYEGDGKNGGGRTSNDVLDAGVKATVKGAEKKATSSRSTRSQGTTKTGCDDQVAAPTTAPATAPAPGTPKVRRVRQLGASKTNSTPAAAAGTKIASFLSVASTAGGIQKRTKLIPKAPSVVVTGTPVTEKKKILPRASSSSSDDSTDGSTLGMKSKNLLKVHAGSTPMPRRIGRRP